SAVRPWLGAAPVRPSALMRAGWQQRMTLAEPLATAARACFAIAALASRLPPVRGIAVAGYTAVLVVVAGFSLLAPAIVRGTALATRPLLRRTFGIVGELAAGLLPASLRRTSIASAALSLATG